MIRLLFLTLILLSQVAFSQERKIQKGLNFLKSGEYDEAKEILNEFNLKNQNSPLGDYLEFKIYSLSSSPFYDLEVAFKSLQNIKKMMNTRPLDESWCKSFGLCSENLDYQLDSIAMIELINIEQNKSDNSYQKFLMNFTDTPANQKGLESFHDWKYKLALEKNTTYDIERFIKEYPNSKLIPLAKKKIEEIEYNNSIKSNDIINMENFINKYPFSIYINEIKNKIEEITFESTKKNGSIENLKSFITKYPNSKYLEEVKKNLYNLNVETIIISSTDSSRELAINSCISKSIELISSIFISTELNIENDLLINENIKQISNGEIIDYEIIQEKIIDDTNWEVTLKINIKLDALSSFFAAKGMILPFDKTSFSYTIKNQKIKENQEISIIYDVIGSLNEGLQTSFEYRLEASSPTKSNLKTIDWKIPLKISVLSNENFKNNYKLLLTTIKFLALSEEEIKVYKKYNKNIYPIVLENSTYYLRNKNSLKAINFLLNNYISFLTSFNIICETDSLNGLNIEQLDEVGGSFNGSFFYLKDPTINGPAESRKNSEVDEVIRHTDEYEEQRPFNKINKTTVTRNNIQEYFVDIKWYNPIKSYNNDVLELYNLIDFDILATIVMNHYVSLDDLKKINNYTIQSNGLRFKYRNKGMVLSEESSARLLLNYFEKVESNKIDTTFKQIPFNKLSDVKIPSIYEAEYIYSLPFNKLLNLPNQTWTSSDGYTCYNNSNKIYYSSLTWNWLYKRYHNWTCSDNFYKNNLILIYPQKK